jgi:hypothetical protein
MTSQQNANQRQDRRVMTVVTRTYVFRKPLLPDPVSGSPENVATISLAIGPTSFRAKLLRVKRGETD